MYTEDHKAYLDKIPNSVNPIASLSDEEYINYWTDKKVWRESAKNFSYVFSAFSLTLLIVIVAFFANFPSDSLASFFFAITFFIGLFATGGLLLYASFILLQNYLYGRKKWREELRIRIDTGAHKRQGPSYKYQAGVTFNRQDFSGPVLSTEEHGAIVANSDLNPTKILSFEDKSWYLYKGKIWRTNEDYPVRTSITSVSSDLTGEKTTDFLNFSEDFKHVLDANEIKFQKKIENAKKLVEQTKSGPVKEERSRRISQDVKDRVWNRDNGECVECGSNENLEFDHIIPFSKGGANTYRNIQLLCEHCNRSKSANIG